MDATRQVGEHAAANGLELAIELLPFPYAFVNTVDRLIDFLDAVNLENVKAAVDISHFWLIRADPTEIRRLEGRVGHVHVADCDGENHGDLPPGRGTTPFLAYLDVLKEIGFAGAASVELEFPEDPARCCPGSKRHIGRPSSCWPTQACVRSEGRYMGSSANGNGTLVSRIRSRELLFAAFANMGSATASELLGRAGFDCVVLDLETASARRQAWWTRSGPSSRAARQQSCA